MTERKKRTPKPKPTTKKPRAKAKTKPKAPAKPKTSTKPKAPPKPKTSTKPKAPSKPKATDKVDKKQELINSGFVGHEESSFHETFPIKFTHKQKDMKEMKVCYFQCEEHMKKYIKRYGLRKNAYKISKTPKNWR